MKQDRTDETNVPMFFSMASLAVVMGALGSPISRNILFVAERPAIYTHTVEGSPGRERMSCTLQISRTRPQFNDQLADMTDDGKKKKSIDY